RHADGLRRWSPRHRRRVGLSRACRACRSRGGIRRRRSGRTQGLSDPMSDPAQLRFFVIQAQRFIGVALVLLGITIVYRRIDLPEAAGYVFIAAGLVDAFIVPTLLARRWKTPSP